MSCLRLGRVPAVMLFLLVLVGCQVDATALGDGDAAGGSAGSAAPSAAATPASIHAVPVMADGRLVPERYATLSSSVGGRVLEIAVREGERVAEGDVLLRVDEALQRAALTEAEAALAGARARWAQLEAGATVDEVAGAEAAVEAARAAVLAAQGSLSAAQANLSRLRAGASDEDLAIASHQLELVKNALWSAQGQRDAVCGRTEEVLAGFCDAARGQVQQAEEQVRIAEAQLRQVQQGAQPQEIAAAEGQVQQALGQRAVAEAQAAQAEAALAQLRAGSSAEARAAAEAQVAQAQAAVDRARLVVERSTLRAPFSATVVALNARLGEELAPGQPALQLADLSSWRVETDDLTELDVVRLYEGQGAMLVPDALPELRLEGVVQSVGQTYQLRGGEVLYTVRVRVEASDPRLRWGMTVAVTFEE